MSRETIQWLNENTLIGFEDKRGPAWHKAEGSTNHYPEAIPVEDVRKRLFSWEPEEQPVSTIYGAIPNMKAIVRSDTHAFLGMHTDGYQIHGYNEWLINKVESIIGQDLRIGSAGLLRGGAVAWAQMELPENVLGPSGIAVRPNLLAVTSLDGRIKTTYKRTVTNVVCDNTMALGLGELGGEFGVKHTKNSAGKLEEIREALALQAITETEAAFMAEVEKLLKVKVPDKKFEMWLNLAAPIDGKSGRGLTVASAKRDKMWELWEQDPMVSPWKRTAYGVVQAASTYAQHFTIVKNGASRTEKNMFDLMTGATGKVEQEALAQLASIK